jgi:hypothetical protein
MYNEKASRRVQDHLAHDTKKVFQKNFKKGVDKARKK